MAKLDQAGLGVYNNYGPRTTSEGRSGKINTAGKVWELELDFRAPDMGTLSASIPAGAKVLEAFADVKEVFGGLTDLDVGALDLDPTAVAVSELVLASPLDAVLASDYAVSVTPTGTSDGTGYARVVIRYVLV